MNTIKYQWLIAVWSPVSPHRSRKMKQRSQALKGCIPRRKHRGTTCSSTTPGHTNRADITQECLTRSSKQQSDRFPSLHCRHTSEAFSAHEGEAGTMLWWRCFLCTCGSTQPAIVSLICKAGIQYVSVRVNKYSWVHLSVRLNFNDPHRNAGGECNLLNKKTQTNQKTLKASFSEKLFHLYAAHTIFMMT